MRLENIDKENKEQLRKRILVADDEEGVLRLVTKILERMGHIVETVKSGEELLRQIPQEKYDLIITDNTFYDKSKMPSGRTGVEIVRLLRQNSHYKDLPVLVYSGDDLEETGIDELAKELGAEFLSKPFLLPDFKAKIEE